MRYLFCAFPTPGLLYPLVGLALELRCRGHDVAFVTGRFAEPTLGCVGIDRIVRGESDGDGFRIQQWGTSRAIASDVTHIEYAMRDFAPDILVANLFALGAYIVRERTGVPLCVMGMAAYLWPRRSGSRPVFPQCESLARWRCQGALDFLDDARALFSLSSRHSNGDASPLLGDVFLLRSVAELECEPESLPAEVRLVGACEWEPRLDADAVWQDLCAQTVADRGRVLYVHHGRAFGEPSFWPPLVEALEKRPFRVFASVGRMDSSTGISPSSFVVRGHVPQGVVLPHADLVVSGAHSSVMLGALTHGVPSVVLPHNGGEMPDNAARLERARCAVRLDPYTVTAPVMRGAIDAALEDEFLRTNAHRLREAFQRVEGFRAAADAVERLH